MKINVIGIFVAHLRTLGATNGSKFILYFDFLLFFGLPVVLGIASWVAGLTAPEGIISTAIAVFSVFSALLFSAQAAVFTLSRLANQVSKDPIQAKLDQQDWNDRLRLFSEVNANISYLIAFSVLSLLLLLSFALFEIDGVMATSCFLVVATHFALTLLMVIKRTASAFSVSY